MIKGLGVSKSSLGQQQKNNLRVAILTFNVVFALDIPFMAAQVGIFGLTLLQPAIKTKTMTLNKPSEKCKIM